MTRTKELRYSLNTLFDDQPEWFAFETIPHLLAWLGNPRPPMRFLVTDATEATSRLIVTWSTRALRARLPDLDDLVARLVAGRSVQVEQVPQYGACGLAGVVLAAVLHRRVVALRPWSPPDLLFDTTAGAMRGVEVAGRSKGGFSALRTAADEKRPGLVSEPNVAEAWLSLWCRTPPTSLLLKVRP